MSDLPAATIARHRSLAEMAADIKAVVVALQLACGLRTIEILPASSFANIIARMANIAEFPACLISAGAVSYAKDGSSQRVREPAINLTIIGDFNADTDAGATTIWDITDRLATAFLPQIAGSRAVIIEGVRYQPGQIEPVPCGDDRSAFNLQLAATDPMAARTNPDYEA